MFPADDTIVAISTAAGSAARAIVRLSGPAAAGLASAVFQPAEGTLAELGGFRAAEGLARLSHPPIEVPARAYVFRAPRSYTRQDVVELHVPGAAPLARELLQALVEAGARPAQGGEFTARAFFSGRIDLSRAEAVADLIGAADAAQARAAMAALGGAVHRLCRDASAALAEKLAMVEASIDLSEEELDLPSSQQLADDLRRLADTLRRFRERSGDSPDAPSQPHAAIAGRPNVGKSSLLNCLTGTDRAIVCALAGTTRDVLSAPMSLGGGGPLILQDVAGFAPAGGREPDRAGGGCNTVSGIVPPPSDVCLRVKATPPSQEAAWGWHEQAGGASSLWAAAHAAARHAVDSADLIVFVVDLAGADFAPDLALLEEVRRANPRAPIVLAGNKSDLLPEVDREARLSRLKRAAGGPSECPAVSPSTPLGTSEVEPLAVSCATGLGLADLRSALGRHLHLSAGRGGELMGLHERQKRCLLEAGEAADRAAEILLADTRSSEEVRPCHRAGPWQQAELVAVELREALFAVGQISGQVVTEDILGQIFARFCVGK